MKEGGFMCGHQNGLEITTKETNRNFLKNDCIRIALSSDGRAHSYHATLIASILRRTELPVHVRCWCRGFLPESFETGALKVEFIPAVEEVAGKYPGSSGPAAYDRLLVIRDCPDWDRCMVMDCDQLVLCDLAPLFSMELGDHLLAAHMQGPGVDMDYAMRVWLKRPIPAGWEHVGTHPYFLMPPLLNLKAMREAGTWETFLAAHAAFGADEQLSLTAATEGRSLPLDRKWNLFPQLHIKEHEVPEGIIHWSGWPKPWHRDAKVWRPDIWESEKSSWEHLRMGIWAKPLAIEIEPDDERGMRALAQRGWRVRVFSGWEDDGGKDSDGHRPTLQVERRSRSEAVEAVYDRLTLQSGTPEDEANDGHRPTLQDGFPDLTFHDGGPAEFRRMLEEGNEIDRVRLGPWEDAGDWLEGCGTAPEYLVLNGALDAAEADRVRNLGYTAETRLMTGEWPAGGPLPRALDFHAAEAGSGIAAGEELILKWDEGKARSGGRLALGETPRTAVAREPKKVGLLVIATAKYRRFVKPLLRSVRRNFLPGHEVTVFLFTDGEVAEAPGLQVVPVAHGPWPAMALRRYAIFLEHAERFAGMDFLYYLDADMRAIGKVGEEILGDLVGVLHPGFYDKPREKLTYERRAESEARVGPDEGTRYFCSAFQGGRAAVYLEAARTMAEKIDQDEARGITAVWYDESHWNRYLIDHPPSLVLSPSYCWHPDGRSKEFEGKIAVVQKDAAEIRQ